MPIMRQFVAIFALTAFLLGIIAPACAFMWGGQYSVIEICSAMGIEKRVVANNETPSEVPAPQALDQCDFCFQSAHFGGSFVPVPLLEKIRFQSDKIRHRIYQDIVHSRTLDNVSARGPPSLA